MDPGSLFTILLLHHGIDPVLHNALNRILTVEVDADKNDQKIQVINGRSMNASNFSAVILCLDSTNFNVLTRMHKAMQQITIVVLTINLDSDEIEKV